MQAFTIILLILLVALAAAIFHKVRRAHLMLFNIKDELESLPNTHLMDLFHQIEALHGLTLDLKLEKSLPATRGWVASPDFLKAITGFALKAQPNVVVECSSGVSTLVLARCMQLNNKGHVYSLEHDEHHANITRNNLEKLGLDEFATVIHSPLIDHNIENQILPWYDINELPKTGIDLLVIDGPPKNIHPQSRYPAGPLLFNSLTHNSGVFLDDANREDEQKIVEKWLKENIDLEKVNEFYCEKGCAYLHKN